MGITKKIDAEKKKNYSKDIGTDELCIGREPACSKYQDRI